MSAAPRFVGRLSRCRKPKSMLVAGRAPRNPRHPGEPRIALRHGGALRRRPLKITPPRAGTRVRSVRVHADNEPGFRLSGGEQHPETLDEHLCRNPALRSWNRKRKNPTSSLRALTSQTTKLSPFTRWRKIRWFFRCWCSHKEGVRVERLCVSAQKPDEHRRQQEVDRRHQAVDGSCHL